MTVLPAVLLGLAVTLLVHRTAPRHRLRALTPAVTTPPRAGMSPALRQAVCVLAGAALWWLVGGPLGLALAVASIWLGPRGLARLDDTEGDERVLAQELPLALDLLGACLTGGSGLREAVFAVAEALPGPCGERLSRVGAALTLGAPPTEAFRALGVDRGPGGTAARALTRAAEGGAPVAQAVSRVAADARRAAAAESTRRAKRAGVLAVGPLGACFLPAFVLLGIVPTVVGLATPLLSSL